jgi:hypothetical protein
VGGHEPPGQTPGLEHHPQRAGAAIVCERHAGIVLLEPRVAAAACADDELGHTALRLQPLQVVLVSAEKNARVTRQMAPQRFQRVEVAPGPGAEPRPVPESDPAVAGLSLDLPGQPAFLILSGTVLCL